jgi:2'-5' RNA ligase
LAEEYYPTGETAVIIVPPPDIIRFADHYRSLYMPTTMREIEPHITLVYPFVHYDRLPEAEPLLRETLAPHAPIHLSLRGFDRFPGSGVLFLYSAHEERLHELYRAIFAAFPGQPAYGGVHGDDWRPHMTVGRFDDAAALEAAYKDLSGLRLYIGFDVESVTVKYRTSDGIWDTYAEIPLSGGADE